MASRYVVIGTHHGYDKTVALDNIFTTYSRALEAAERLRRKGWVTEIVELMKPGEIGRVDGKWD